MALRVGSVGLDLKREDSRGLTEVRGLLRVEVGPRRNFAWIGSAVTVRSIRQAINNQLRTGTDKGIRLFN